MNVEGRNEVLLEVGWCETRNVLVFSATQHAAFLLVRREWK